jgi:hypothetical protein
MKTIFILLLGFGGTYPMVCSKKQNKKNQESELRQQRTPTLQKNFVNPTKQHNLTLSKNNTIEIYS